MALGTIGYYVYLMVAEWALGEDIYGETMYVIIFFIVNSANLVLPLSKYALIWYESGLEYNDETGEMDCGYFNCMWSLDTHIGWINLDVEMYPDIFKVAQLFSNYLIYLLFPWINEWISENLSSTSDY